MRKVIFIFGLISGVVLSIFFFIIMWLCRKGSIGFDNSDLIGWASIVIALSMIFFGIKSYRDNYQKGVITFWKGFQVGLLITLISGLIYGVAGEILHRADPVARAALMEKYAEHQVNKLRDRGASAAEIEKMTNDMVDLRAKNESGLFRFAFALVIVLPVGVVISLLSALLLRKKEFLPA